MAANANDQRLSFSQFPQTTRRLGCDVTSRFFFEAIPPGKYVAQFMGLGANTAWVRVGAYIAAPTVVADMVFGAPAGARVTITSAGNNFPQVELGQIVEIRDHSDPQNNGPFITTVVAPTTGAITMDKINGPNPIAALVESAAVWQDTIVAEVPGAVAAGAIDVVPVFPIDAAVPSFIWHVRSAGAGNALAVVLSAGTATLVLNKLSES